MAAATVQYTANAVLGNFFERDVGNFGLNHLPNLLLERHVFNNAPRRCGEYIEIGCADNYRACYFACIATRITGCIGENISAYRATNLT